MKCADFENCRWVLQRRIDDRRAGAVSQFSGYARVQNGVYKEVGELTLPDGTVLKSTRRYFWADGVQGIEISFDDGRPFHVLHPQAGLAQAAHLCGDDHYDVQYDFSDWPKWVSIWQVLGPRKDYTMTTQYQKYAP